MVSGGDFQDWCYKTCKEKNKKYFAASEYGGWVRCKCTDTEGRADTLPDSSCNSWGKLLGNHDQDIVALFKVDPMTLEECSEFCQSKDAAFFAYSETEKVTCLCYSGANGCHQEEHPST